MDFDKLVHMALRLKPEIILNFKGKDGLVLSRNYITTAILQDPMVIAKMNDELRSFIDKELFVLAFARNPLVLSIKDLAILNKRLSREVTVVEDDKEVTKKVTTTLRTECLKAIRLNEGTSVYHKGYDDIAIVLAKLLKSSKHYQANKYNAELLQNFATLMNALIKKKDQKLRAVSADAWLVNNGKPMYKAIRTSAKKDSELEGLITDMPTEMLPKKVIKKLIIAAIKVNPEYYLKLESYGFGEYVDDVTIKYNVYKSLKQHGMLRKVGVYLDEKSATKAKNKLEGVKKRKIQKAKVAEQTNISDDEETF